MWGFDPEWRRRSDPHACQHADGHHQETIRWVAGLLTSHQQLLLTMTFDLRPIKFCPRLAADSPKWVSVLLQLAIGNAKSVQYVENLCKTAISMEGGLLCGKEISPSSLRFPLWGVDICASTDSLATAVTSLRRQSVYPDIISLTGSPTDIHSQRCVYKTHT